MKYNFKNSLFILHIFITTQIDIWNEIRRNASVHVMFDKIKQSWLIPAFESLHMKPIVIREDVQK